MRTAFLIFVLSLTAGLMFTLQAYPLFDQGMVKGVIIDSIAQTPLPYANILLYRQNDSSFAGGTNTGINGEFILNNIIEGKYLIKVNLLGYQNKYIANIAIGKDKVEYNAGVIQMAKKTIELNEAEVTGERPSEELHLDKKVINVSQNLTSAGGTALDVLENQPSVRVDADGNVFLRGSSNFTVLINGKPNVLQGADALKQIAANMIDNIELITNPSSKYDAEGSAGIININLKKQNDYTLSGILNVNTGSRDKYNSDFSGNYNYNGFNITAGMDYRNNSNFIKQDVNRTSFTASENTYNHSLLDIRSKRKEYSGRTTIDYNVNEQNQLSLSLNGGQIDIERFLDAKILNNTNSLTEYAENTGVNNFPLKYFNSSFNYTYKFIPKVNDLTFEAAYSNVTYPQNQLNAEYMTDPSFTNRLANPVLRLLSNDASRREVRSKMNYTHKISENSTFEMGVQSNFSFRKFDVINRIFDWNINEYVTDDNLTNNFNYRNNVYAGFVSYSNAISDFEFQLGLRGEYMDRLLTQNTLGGDYKYEKMDYFPSFSISKKIDDHQLQFSYSRRVNRPDENILNPFPFYQDKYLSSKGNPYLLPQYTNSYELNYQKVFGSVFLSAQTYYRNTNNSFQQTFSMDDEGRLTTNFVNFGTDNTYGTEISSSFSIAQIIKLDPAIDLHGTDINGIINGSTVERNFFNWNARLNTTITFTPDTRMMISGNYFDKIMDAQHNVKPFFLLTASLKQDFLEKRFSLTLQARNILRTSYMDVSGGGNNFDSTVKVKQEVPVITLMASYNFNNFKKSPRPTENIDVPTGL